MSRHRRQLPGLPLGVQLPAFAEGKTAGYKPIMLDFEAERDALWIDRLASAFAHQLAAPARDALCVYASLVATWNRKINLTAAREPQALCEVLLADAFALCDRTLVPEGSRVLDIGTGAGAPIVPLLLLRPDLSVVGLEPQHKRAAFLRTLCARLGLLERARVLEARIDPDRPQSPEGTFDLACSRATFAPERWLPLGLVLAPRVLVLVAGGEPPAAPPGARLLAIRGYSLPFSGASRSIAVYLRE
jgi:16S rRNA (guanine527-N7)-methyltransferase